MADGHSGERLPMRHLDAADAPGIESKAGHVRVVGATGAHDPGAPGCGPIAQPGSGSGTSFARRSWLISRRLLRFANRGTPRLDFMREVSRLVLELSGCDGIETRLWGDDVCLRWQAWSDGREEVEFLDCPADSEQACRYPQHPMLERVCRMVVRQACSAASPGFTPNGSFWTADARLPVVLEPGAAAIDLGVADSTRSLCLIGFTVDDKNAGLLLLESAKPGLFQADQVEHYEGIAQTLGLAIADRRAQAALRERVKELTCLYGIARLGELHDPHSPELLPGIVEHVRAGFQHPELAAVRVVLGGEEVCTTDWREGGPKLEVAVRVGSRERGRVIVSYPKPDVSLELDPFLPEESVLLAAVARELALLLERSEAEAEKNRLQEQLRHADRLATIGQLAAGVAHELNEPLTNILGFAELLSGSAELPGQARADTRHIEEAALHAREVIRKLMLFARQAPPRTGLVDLNSLVLDGLLFLEGRCAKSDVELVRLTAPGLPEVEADASQILQVLINLVVNAVQAMSSGGRLAVATGREDDWVFLRVADTGVGMSPEVLRQAFVPFFTTKDVNEGTGLGLAVVHGIVTAHGGKIDVESKVGVGTTFTVRLPRRTGGDR
ncbi:MAG: ATP-binding protein [bacterium]